jgi:nucleotide-binding universal stress UspA family protein
MKTVLAAVDNSPAGKLVIETALALAEVLGAQVEAIHVRTDGDTTVRSAADVAGVPLRTVSGPVIESLIVCGKFDSVVAIAIGARSTPGSGRPLGGTAAAVATKLLKPVVIVPRDAAVPARIRRVLVPLEGDPSTSSTPDSILDLGAEAKIDVVGLHVLDEDSIPAFTDQPQHEQRAWTHEFLARYCPWGLGIRFETRVGRTAEFVAEVAEQTGCDLIALGWSQELAPGRAPVVRATLQRSRLPVILVPVRPANGPFEDEPVLSGDAAGR